MVWLYLREQHIIREEIYLYLTSTNCTTCGPMTSVQFLRNKNEAVVTTCQVAHKLMKDVFTV